MLKQIEKILAPHYRITYTSIYSKEVYKKDHENQLSLNQKKYFTLIDKNGLVIGRIHNLEEGQPFESEHLPSLAFYFQTFELPHRDKILKKIKQL